MDPEIKNLIHRFNENIEWLRKNQGRISYSSLPLPSMSETMGMDEARETLKRGRTWITRRMLAPEDVQEGTDTNQYLVYGLDWFREGSQIRFNSSSVMRLKQVLRDMGDKYQRRNAMARA